MNNGIIKVNELRLENNEYQLRPCLINVTKIISVQSGELSKGGPHIIGDERERTAQMITLEGNHRIFVDTEIDDIFQMVIARS